MCTSLIEYNDPGPGLLTVWADTDSPVYYIEINEINGCTSKAAMSSASCPVSFVGASYTCLQVRSSDVWAWGLRSEFEEVTSGGVHVR